MSWYAIPAALQLLLCALLHRYWAKGDDLGAMAMNALALLPFLGMSLAVWITAGVFK